jgi:hypothetical protein
MTPPTRVFRRPARSNCAISESVADVSRTNADGHLRTHETCDCLRVKGEILVEKSVPDQLNAFAN